MKFSQRIGIAPLEKMIQIDSIDEELRNSLWSVLDVFYWETFNKEKYGFQRARIDYISGSNLDVLFRELWLYYFKKPIDTIPDLYWDSGLMELRDYFFNAQWYEVYDFIEFVSDHGPSEQKSIFNKACNKFLERENSAYRFVSNKIVEISSADEVAEIEGALQSAAPFFGVKQHLLTAITLLSDRESPDYRNSIKESISAVESLCKTIAKEDKATLGAALKLLEKNGVLHPALKSAFSSLYGYTNDADGIRHALMEESSLTKADARFMLISCSAFINFVIASVANDV